MLIPYTQLNQTDLPWTDGIAVIPLGAVETHGPHLPLGTDGLIAEGVLDQASPRMTTKAARLPLMWLGASAEHSGRAGTLSREPEDMIGEVVALGAGLHAAGFRRVVLFNGHGGNAALASIAALKLRTRFDFLVASAHWLDFGFPDAFVPPASAVKDVHGGWIETSVLLHLAPDQVKMSAAQAADATPPASVLYPEGPIAWGWKTDDLTDGGWIGRPDLARADIGKRLVDHAAEKLAALIDALALAQWP